MLKKRLKLTFRSCNSRVENGGRIVGRNGHRMSVPTLGPTTQRPLFAGVGSSELMLRLKTCTCTVKIVSRPTINIDREYS